MKEKRIPQMENFRNKIFEINVLSLLSSFSPLEKGHNGKIFV